MSKKLYVGNISDDTTEEDLLDNFGDLGTCVSAQIIRDKETGRSKGFAFVEMSTAEEGREVIKICRGVELDGKKLVVSAAKPPAKQPGSSRRGRRSKK
jgi:RNA recognition motif-containing protein